MAGGTLRKEIRKLLPKLKPGNHKVTSEADNSYNCISWAIGLTNQSWWPSVFYWPPNVPAEESIAAFVAAFETLGFSRCNKGTLESGFEKIAIFLKERKPTHAARQLSNGRWTSKLGPQEDIEHRSTALLFGDEYGRRVIYMKRPAQADVKETDFKLQPA